MDVLLPDTMMISSLPELPPTFVSVQEGRSGGPAFVSHEDGCSLPVTKMISSLPELPLW
jgi:hypothetical protein